LDKFRLRSSNRNTANSPAETDNLGLTSLLGLSVLAGAGAGLLRSVSTTGPGGAGLWTMGDQLELDGNGDQLLDRVNHGRNAFRASNTPELPIQRYLANQVGDQVFCGVLQRKFRILGICVGLLQ
uniref:Secreted protein n=1 Tax=Echinostoma caproni TaxID=27848 RepID=A0A183BDK5_9TREM